LSRSFLIAAAIIVAIIVYCSLYPFSFHIPASGSGPAHKLIESWSEAPSRGDFLANIIFYLPFGFFGVLAIARGGRLFLALALAIVIGALLSISMELTQYYVEGRVTAASDVYANVIGTTLGAVIGSITSANFRWPLLREISSNRVPSMLLALWLGYRLFPYVPTTDLHKYWVALKPVLVHPSLTGYDLFRYAATWLTLSPLIEAIAGRKRVWFLFPVFIGSMLIAKVVIVDRALSAAEVVGAGLAIAAWLTLAVGVGARLRITFIALLLSASVIAERLAPFEFAPHAREFAWVPFRSFIYGSLEVGIMSFFEKTFLYGSLIWLLGETGLRLGTSAMLVATMLFATSWAETYLPNRSAEITDALMALLIGAIIALMQTARKAEPASSAR
jgi:VanZ family protein